MSFLRGRQPPGTSLPLSRNAETAHELPHGRPGTGIRVADASPAGIATGAARRVRHVEPFMDSGVRVTALLHAWAGGDSRRAMTSHSSCTGSSGDAPPPTCGASGPTIPCSRPRSPTSAFVRLIGQQHVEWRGRAHFFAVAAQMMRRVLVDYARERHAAKRARSVRVELNDQIGASPPPDCEVLLLDRALDELARLDPRLRRSHGNGNRRGLGCTGASRPALAMMRVPISAPEAAGAASSGSSGSASAARHGRRR